MTNNYTKMEICNGFLVPLKDSLFKIIGLSKDGNIYIDKYIDSVKINLVGATRFECLRRSYDFNVVINTVIYFINNKYSKEQIKREMFKCMDLIDKIICEMPFEDNTTCEISLEDNLGGDNIG